MKFRGSFVPLITPFDRKGRLDQKTLEKLISWHIDEGTDGLVCSATTGEGPCLSDVERKKIASSCIQIANGKIPIIVSTGTNDTKASVRYTEMALKLGASGCLVVTPYYNKPAQRGCILHFQEIAKVGLPVIMYHNPPRAVIHLEVETILELSSYPNIVAIKESSSNIPLVRKIHQAIDVFSGDDDQTLSIIREGGVGSIATTANVIPRIWKAMVSSALQGNWDEAERNFTRVLPLCKALFSETNPQGVKFALSHLEKCQPFLRLPLVLPTFENREKIEKEILKFFVESI